MSIMMRPEHRSNSEQVNKAGQQSAAGAMTKVFFLSAEGVR
jgi:hypothetical protein